MARGGAGPERSPERLSERSPERFGAGALLAVLMFAPAALLVWRGNLSVDDAVLRFGVAWVVAVCGVGLVSATLGVGRAAAGAGVAAAGSGADEATAGPGSEPGAGE